MCIKKLIKTMEDNSLYIALCVFMALIGIQAGMSLRLVSGADLQDPDELYRFGDNDDAIIWYDPNQLTATWTSDANLTLEFTDSEQWE